jgi:hypothetical protein
MNQYVLHFSYLSMGPLLDALIMTLIYEIHRVETTMTSKKVNGDPFTFFLFDW